MSHEPMTADLLAIAADFDAAMERAVLRRRRRLRAVRVAGASAGCAAVLSGSALAAGEAGIIALPGGLRAQELPPAPLERPVPPADVRMLVCEGDDCRAATADERAELRRGAPSRQYRFHYRITKPGVELDWHTDTRLQDDPDAVGDGTVRIRR